MIYCS